MTTARRICLIDDDTFARNALTLALEDAGYQVVSAPGAAAGFDAVRRNGADAIVTDMNMPGTDGAELITQARAAWPKMPIVAISGSSVVGERALTDVAKDRGANAALAKPFPVRDLTAVLEKLLNADG
ncbi:MAG TPA: response regulator [Vitreimonas sp.]|jgi:CheY-like chemotaxis protein|nr:response regulator [Vitreimonas sp.]